MALRVDGASYRHLICIAQGGDERGPHAQNAAGPLRWCHSQRQLEAALRDI